MEIPSQSGSPAQIGQALRRAAIEARYQSARPLERAAVAAAAEDRLEISPGGRDLARLRGVLLERAQALPEVREERLAQVRQRVAAGFYDGEDIVAQISDRMVKQSALGELVPGGDAAAPGTPTPDPAYRGDLMRQVNDKIQSGFYSDQDVMRFVADRLMDIYQIQPQDDEG